MGTTNPDVDMVDIFSSTNNAYFIQFEDNIVKLYDTKRRKVVRLDTLQLVPKSQGDDRKRMFFISHSRHDGKFMINSWAVEAADNNSLDRIGFTRNTMQEITSSREPELIWIFSNIKVISQHNIYQ